MRLPSLLLSVVVLPTASVVVPVVSNPAAADPRPVRPAVQELELDGDAQLARAAVEPGGTQTVVLTEERDTEQFSTLGVTWAADPAVGEVVVSVRTRGEGGWTGWSTLEEAGVEADGSPAAAPREGSEPLYTGPSDGVQVRVDVRSGAAPTDLRLALVDPGTSPADASTGTSATLGAASAEAAAARPAIRSRAEWGADESIRRSPSFNDTVEAVTVHHTASSNNYTAAEVPGLLRGFYAYHVKSLGWSDIGYNVLVDKFGTAWEGRAGGLDRAPVGAHAGGFNTDTYGLSMIGEFTSVEPSAAMKEKVAQVAAWKLGQYGRDARGSVALTSRGSTRYSSGTVVTLPRIFAHRQVSTTACPGERGYAMLPWLRDRAAALNAGSTPAPAPAPAPVQAADPFGSLDAVQQVDLEPKVRVSGWAIDPDAAVHTTVRVQVDGAVAGSQVADDPRPDVAAVFPQYSPNHGYDMVLPLSPGRHEVCVVAVNQATGKDVQLGCRTLTVLDPKPPFGGLEDVRPTADVVAVRVRGWLIDPDATSAAELVVRVDGVPAGRGAVGLPRPDVARVYSQHPQSADSGYDVVVPAAPGAREVCVIAVNQGPGSDELIGCRSTTVPDLSASATASAPGARAVDDSCPAGRVPAAPFRDTVGTTHQAAVDCVVWWGVASGTSETTYAPAGKVNRAQLASFLARVLVAAGVQLPASPPDAFDDDRGSVHERAINQLAALGALSGKGARIYDPNGLVTREQMATYLVRVYEQRAGGPLPTGRDWFTDDNGSAHHTNIGKAALAGFTSGVSATRFAPTEHAGRGQVASFLARVLDLMVQSGRAPGR